MWQHYETCDAGRDALGTAPVTILPTPAVRTPPHHTYGPGPATCLGRGSDDATCPSRRDAQHTQPESQTSPLEGSGTSTQPSDPLSARTGTLSRGSGTAACPATAGARKTLTYRAHEMPSCHVWRTVHPIAMTMPLAGAGRTPARSPQDQGRYPGRLPRLTPCPTVYFLQYSASVPRDSGENDDFHAPTHVHRPSL